MATSILRKYSRDPLFGFSREEAILYLQNALNGRCLEAYLYGSFARDQLDAGSDIDCIIVADSEVGFTDRADDFVDLRRRLPSLEIFVYTKAEFDKLMGDPTMGFWQSICSEMMQIL